jgi:hypothetical protein
MIVNAVKRFIQNSCPIFPVRLGRKEIMDHASKKSNAGGAKVWRD